MSSGRTVGSLLLGVLAALGAGHPVPPPAPGPVALRARLEHMVMAGVVDATGTGEEIRVRHWLARPPGGRELVETRLLTEADETGLTLVDFDGGRVRYRLGPPPPGGRRLELRLENQNVELGYGEVRVAGRSREEPRTRGLEPGWVVYDPETAVWCDPTPAPDRIAAR